MAGPAGTGAVTPGADFRATGLGSTRDEIGSGFEATRPAGTVSASETGLSAEVTAGAAAKSGVVASARARTGALLCNVSATVSELPPPHATRAATAAITARLLHGLKPLREITEEEAEVVMIRKMVSAWKRERLRCNCPGPGYWRTGLKPKAKYQKPCFLEEASFGQGQKPLLQAAAFSLGIPIITLQNTLKCHKKYILQTTPCRLSRAILRTASPHLALTRFWVRA